MLRLKLGPTLDCGGHSLASADPGDCQESTNGSSACEGVSQSERGVRRPVRLDYMGLSFHDLIILKELDDGGVREPRQLKSLCLKTFCFYSLAPY